ncbi:Structural maintenance of chromosomes protein 5 [Dermatophagoides farinae]|uniref:Structural maintenance of chromosomes protein 5 n=1 Tax=Dermatophagoides farinae TaxID=6954 RepID=A0A922L3A8_DERFA|nr:structural maintenance of chromosomes protein 5-like [Dermatophagoides farinae]KAH7646400.1 smc protein-like protein [Dermatophagoides farinae]KAH9516853.1 Structural maintenance of chromosomes protein 5 [Dermatophagoides farinae]
MIDKEKFHNFKIGSIVRIELENFMIYKHIEFLPGPFLNLILGPNGSGKSALVCSIIMGFGGDPQITGRSSNLIDYVRTGAHSASIIIEIHNPMGKNQLIQREIRISRNNRKTECHNVWRLNQKTVKKEEIAEFTKRINIDVNNLCQILPQERVVEFSRLNSKDLLFSTEKSIGNVNMYEQHMKLIELSSEIVDLESKISETKSFLIKYKNFQTNIEPDLKLIQEKKRYEENIQWLYKKQVWLQYEEKRLVYLAARNEFDEKKKEYDEFVSKIEPLKINREKAVKMYREIKQTKQTSKFISKLAESYKTIQMFRNTQKEHVASYHETLSEQKRNKDRLSQYRQDYRNYTNDLENHPKMSDLEADSAKIKAKLDEFDKKIRENISASSTHRSRYENAISEKRFHDNRKKEIKNLFNARMEKINQRDTWTRSAYEWLLKNKDRFEGEVFPPLITQINVVSDEYANSVEVAIGTMDMSTFLFEKLSDLEYFNENLKKDLNIRVNVAMIPQNDIDNEPTFNIEKYKFLGIFARVSDLFTAPKKVMSYLIKNYHINQIPVGNAITEDKIQELINHSSFRKIITPKNLYLIVISSYDGEKSTQIIPMPPAKFLNIIINDKEIEEIDRTLVVLEKQITESQAMVQKYTNENDILKENRGKLSDEFKTIGIRKSGLRTIQAKIDEKKRQIDHLEKLLKSENKHKEELIKNLEEQHRKEMSLLEKLPNVLVEAIKFNKSDLLAASKAKKISRIKDRLEIIYSNLESHKNEKFVVINQLNNNFKELQKTTREFRKYAIEKSGFNFNEDLDEEIRKKMHDLPEKLDEISDMIDTLKLRCEGIQDVDQSLLEDYKRYQLEIQNKYSECEKYEQQLDCRKQEINSLKPIWLTELKGLIDKINENFTKFMDHLNYSGEVYLFTGDKEYSFDDYGIRIKVKFRDAEPFKDLDVYHQSGGERSVSTMVYMLSLQELAHVPFRVVDEINQGMDENNERCVFDLIAEVSKRNSSQYFLLSPKLLTKLKYTDEMKIHIIFNGPHSYVNWNKSIEDILQDDEDDGIKQEEEMIYENNDD